MKKGTVAIKRKPLQDLLKIGILSVKRTNFRVY
jgi:hypothetical protein